MQIDRRIIESNLPPKGFAEDRSGDHRYFYHEYQGRRTGISTYTSHGSHYKTYGVALLKRMKNELRLDTIRQVGDLFKCPLTGDGYNQILRSKGLI